MRQYSIKSFVFISLLFTMSACYQSKVDGYRRADGSRSLLILDNKLDQINKIQLEQKAKNVLLEATNHQWQVELDGQKIRANKRRVINSLDTIRDVKIMRNIRLSKSNWDQFEVQNGVKLKLFRADKQVLGVVLGKVRIKGGQYIRFLDDPRGEVYLIDRPLKIDLDAASWAAQNLQN